MAAPKGKKKKKNASQRLCVMEFRMEKRRLANVSQADVTLPPEKDMRTHLTA
jgi:hypothetical protein